MSKKKKLPQIEYKEFWATPTPETIPTKLFKKETSLINTAITRRDWFKNCPFYKTIISNTSFLNEDADFAERIYCFKNEIHSKPLCPITNKPLLWSKQKHTYNIGADASASARLWKRDKTKISNDAKKRHKNALENILYMFKNNQYKLLSIDEIKMYIDSFINNENIFKQLYITHIKNDVNELCSILYYTKQYDKFIDTSSKWCARMYIIYNDYFNVLNNFIEKYQAIPRFISFKDGFSKKPNIDNSQRLNNKIFWLETINAQNFSIINENYINDPIHRRTTLKCNICGTSFTRNLSSGLYKNILCPGCNKDPHRSRLEQQLVEDIKKIYNKTIILNDKNILNGRELDIYIPEKKLGIELNGVLWHSFGITYPNNVDKESSEKRKHYEKYINCKRQGITLLQFTDIDYIFKKDIVINLIKAKLDILDNKIYARKCIVKSITKKEKKDFCDLYHIQGDGNSQLEYGLFYNGELISVMTFGKRSITKGEPKMEIIRFCTKFNYRVIGGASKLLKYFIKNNKCNKLKTYSDNSISDGKLYETLGFKLVNETKFNYWYIAHDNHNKLYHRSNFMRHKLNTNLTEKEEMYKRKYRRYYDAGNKVFEMIIEQ